MRNILKIFYVSLTLFCITPTAHAQTVKALNFLDESGATHSLKEFEGKVILLNIWATWCKPCVAEMPSLNRLAQSMQGKNVEVVTVNVDTRTIEHARNFFTIHNINNLTLFYDPSMRILYDLKLRGIPASLVINSKGEIQETLFGAYDWNSKEMQEKLLRVK